MQNRKQKLIVLVLAPAVLLASLSSLLANRANDRPDDAARLELKGRGVSQPRSAAARLARPTRMLLPDALERAEDIRVLFANDESAALYDLQKQIGVSRPWGKAKNRNPN